MSNTDLRHHCYAMGYSDGEVGAFYDGYEQGRADALDEFLELFCDKNNQSNFITLSHHHHSWNGYAKHVVKQLKEQE